MLDVLDYGGEELRIEAEETYPPQLVAKRAMLNGHELRGLVGMRIVREQPRDGKQAATVVLILTGVEALVNGECRDLSISIGDNAKATLAAWKSG